MDRWKSPPCRSQLCRWYRCFRPDPSCRTRSHYGPWKLSNQFQWISRQKTKVIRVGYTNSRVPITIGGLQVEEVPNFTYLGSINSSDGDAVWGIAWYRPIWNSPCRLNFGSWPRSLCWQWPTRAKPGRWWKLLKSWMFSISNVFDTSSRSFTGTMLRTWKYTVAPAHCSSPRPSPDSVLVSPDWSYASLTSD